MPSAIDGSRVVRRSEKPQSTLIAFPRVGRSVSDQEYYKINDDEEELSPSNSVDPLETTDSKLGKRARIHTRASKGSMMAFPRVGRSILNNRDFGKHFFGSNGFEPTKKSYDQGILVATILCHI